jgi:hypothetical protein
MPLSRGCQVIDPFSPRESQAYQPATFQERGVAVAFTTPMLAAVRVRHGQRGEIELVMPNPSGGQGVYILPCRGLRSVCQLTVHDNRLNQRIADLRTLSPAAVRQAVVDIAAQGLAGRPAMDAAIAAGEKDRQDRALTRYLLLGALAEKTAPKEFTVPDWRHKRSPELEGQAQKIATQAASKLRMAPEQLLKAIDALAELLSGIGMPGQPEPPRVLRLIGHLVALREQLATWMLEHGDDAQVELADAVAEAARLVIAVADPMLMTAQGMTQDVAALVQTWRHSPDRVAEVADRPEWLLDGWDQIWMLWQSCEGPDQQWAAIAEIIQLIPVLPREIAEWSAAMGTPSARATDHSVGFNAARRTDGAALNLTARNERLRAFAV